jgi:hypothetical protein
VSSIPLTSNQEAAHAAQHRRVPFGGDGPRGTIAWFEHLAAWVVYDARYHHQTAEEIARRGGFGWGEFRAYMKAEPLTFSPTSIHKQQEADHG